MRIRNGRNVEAARNHRSPCSSNDDTNTFGVRDLVVKKRFSDLCLAGTDGVGLRALTYDDESESNAT